MKLHLRFVWVLYDVK